MIFIFIMNSFVINSQFTYRYSLYVIFMFW